MIPEDVIQHWFTYHPPKDNQPRAYEEIRNAGKVLARIINMHAPDGADKEFAIRLVRVAVMAANQAVACEGR
jgi:hypothetical protein